MACGLRHVSIKLRKAYIVGQNSNMTLFGAEVVNRIDLGHTVFFHKTNGIVESQCSDNFTYEVEHIAENLEHLKSMAGNGKLLMMNCVAPYTSLSAAARQFIAKGSQFDFIRAEAYVIHSVAQKMLATFFIRVDKPKVPTKFFLKKEEAELWLLQLSE